MGKQSILSQFADGAKDHGREEQQVEEAFLPSSFEEDLSSFQPVLFDPCCGEPTGWGFVFLKSLGADRCCQLGMYGELKCVGSEDVVGDWILIARRLTHIEAIQKYGSPRDLSTDPKGLFQSVV